MAEQASSFNVICPECSSSFEVTDDLRGYQAECANCSTIFIIPMEGTIGEKVEIPEGVAEVSCPECKSAFEITEDLRGVDAECPSCQTLFTIPLEGTEGIRKDTAEKVPLEPEAAAEEKTINAEEKLPPKPAEPEAKPTSSGLQPLSAGAESRKTATIRLSRSEVMGNTMRPTGAPPLPGPVAPPPPPAPGTRIPPPGPVTAAPKAPAPQVPRPPAAVAPAAPAAAPPPPAPMPAAPAPPAPAPPASVTKSPQPPPAPPKPAVPPPVAEEDASAPERKTGATRKKTVQKQNKRRNTAGKKVESSKDDAGLVNNASLPKWAGNVKLKKEEQVTACLAAKGGMIIQVILSMLMLSIVPLGIIFAGKLGGNEKQWLGIAVFSGISFLVWLVLFIVIMTDAKKRALIITDRRAIMVSGGRQIQVDLAPAEIDSGEEDEDLTDEDDEA